MMTLYYRMRSYFIPNLTATAVIRTPAPVVIGPTRAVSINRVGNRVNRKGWQALTSEQV